MHLHTKRLGAAGVIVRYDGSTWSGMSSGTTQDLSGVWGTSGSAVFAVGLNGTIRQGTR